VIAADQRSAVDEILQTLLVTEEAFVASIGAAVAQQRDGRLMDPSSIRIHTIQAGVAVGTAGLWRVGVDTADGEPTGVFMKGVQHNTTAAHADLWATSDGRPSDPYSWRREIDAAQAGTLQTPVYGVRAPKYHSLLVSSAGIDEHRVGIIAEDARGTAGRDMTLQQLEHVAYQLGAMQGHYFLREVAGNGLKWNWLADGYPREYLKRVDTGLMTDPDNPEAWSQPLLRDFARPGPDGKSVRDATTELYAQRDHYLKIVELLGQNFTPTLSHQDLWYGQLLLEHNGTVLLDLAAAGKGPLGMDMGKLTVEFAARDFRLYDGVREVEGVVFKYYMAGLKRAGVNVDNPMVGKLVKLGWSAGLAAMESYRLGADWVPLAVADQRAQVVKTQWAGREAEEIFGIYLDRSRRLLDHAALALELFHELEPVLARGGLDLREVATPEGAVAATADMSGLIAARPLA
jgi:hypothetical protein